jgi:flagellar basal body L-ring protein FlgH
MIRSLIKMAAVATLAITLSACGEEEKAKTEPPKKAVEKTQPEAKPTPTTAKKSEQDMTPAEALENMQRDAGLVADKAKEGYNAAKEAVTKALSD